MNYEKQIYVATSALMLSIPNTENAKPIHVSHSILIEKNYNIAPVIYNVTSGVYIYSGLCFEILDFSV